jgi:hypothetical protein
MYRYAWKMDERKWVLTARFRISWIFFLKRVWQLHHHPIWSSWVEYFIIGGVPYVIERDTARNCEKFCKRNKIFKKWRKKVWAPFPKWLRHLCYQFGLGDGLPVPCLDKKKTLCEWLTDVVLYVCSYFAGFHVPLSSLSATVLDFNSVLERTCLP